ncbi:MAG: hypothetical protein CM1200mP12_13370 [Gammaproteobacteria bacterium]|nr:MAG: hypothetical protein CM1200mP12_13370 [Gammaproteobacteria bacterium]
MTGITLDSTEEVDAMYAKAIELGASDEGEPGQRVPTFYGAYVRDLDGNKLVFCKMVNPAYFLAVTNQVALGKISPFSE